MQALDPGARKAPTRHDKRVDGGVCRTGPFQAAGCLVDQVLH